MRRISCDRHVIRELTTGWEVAGTAPGAIADAASIDRLGWRPATVPGTVAGAIPGLSAGELDGADWWFRVPLHVDRAADDEQLVLALDGIATVSEVYLNGERLLDIESMFERGTCDIGDRVRGGGDELAICCRALGPLLAVRRRPRARWRTRLVSEGNLRFFRTMLLGRAPGFAPGPPVVGPWRPVRIERRRGASVHQLRLRPRIEDRSGVLAVRATVSWLDPADPPGSASVALSDSAGVHRGQLAVTREHGVLAVDGEVTVPDVERWWPHSHGTPHLYDARLIAGAAEFELGRVGFRELRTGEDLEHDGVQLEINGTPVFARGALWTPVELVAPHASQADLRRLLETVVASGMNMLRVPGIGCYESDTFHDLCDELGLLVWQDFMFANLDYPEQDPQFMATVEREARAELGRVGGRPSLVVVCGGSEVAQQVAMLGLDPALAQGPLFGELLPTVVADAELDAAFVPSAPWGGDLPFRPNRGVANYYGVGAYLRPLDDARRCEVLFAAECLAFANVPDRQALEELGGPGGIVVHDPRWKAGVPRDAGAGWDFEDVRDHYLQSLFGVDPVGLRSVDHDRYLELSGAVTGELMAEVFGEWRRAGSPCGGALVLWLKDVAPGAGWGVLDDRGRPKPAYHRLVRALAPVAVWSTDEGLGGVDIHVANDRPERLEANLRLALYRERELRVEELVVGLEIDAHGHFTDNLEALLGRFVDVAWAYRFGPPAQDLIVTTLEQPGGDGARPISQDFRFVGGRPTERESAERLGVTARLDSRGRGVATVSVSAKRLVYAARIAVAGYRPLEDMISIEPGRERHVALAADPALGEPGRGTLSALNLNGRVAIEQ